MNDAPMRLGATPVDAQDIPQYPWNTGDVLYASALNAAIANNQGAPGAQGPPGPPGSTATQQWQAGVVTTLSPRVLLGGGVLDVAQNWVAGPVSYIGTGLTLQNGVLSAPGPAGAPAGMLPTAGGTMTGPLNWIATGGSTSRAAQDRSAVTLDVMDFGAVGNGTTDDTAAFNAALNSGAAVVTMPIRTFWLPNGITVPSGVELRGTGSFVSNPPLSPSSQILCNPNVNCVVLGTNPTTGVGASATYVVAGSNAPAGTPPTSGAAFYATGCNYPYINRCFAFNTFDGFYFHAVPQRGLGGFMFQCQSSAISGHHVVIDSWAELRITQCRFGGGTPLNRTAIAYFYATGGIAGNIVPNGIFCDNTQCNDGNICGTFLLLGNLLAGGNSAGEWLFTTCHVEQVNNAIATDATCTQVYSVGFANTDIGMNNTTSSFWNLNAATTLVQNFRMVGCGVGFNTFDLVAPTITDCIFVGNSLGREITINATSGSTSTLAFNGNYVQGSLTLAGGWGGLSVLGTNVSGTFTNNATGHVSTSVPSYLSTIDGGIAVSGAAGTYRGCLFYTGGSAQANRRWTLQANSTAESGSNVGSDLDLGPFDDSGNALPQVLRITRSNSMTTFFSQVTTTAALNIGSATGPNIRSGAGAATGTQPKGSIWMRSDGAVGSTMYVSQGGGTWNAVAGV